MNDLNTDKVNLLHSLVAASNTEKAKKLWNSRLETLPLHERIPQDMIRVLMCHPEWGSDAYWCDDKDPSAATLAKDPDGLGLSADVRVELNDFGKRALYVFSSLHPSGREPISYVTAIKNARGCKPNLSKLMYVKKAAREIVAEDTQLWKRRLGAGPKDEYDHFPIAFDTLFAQWCVTECIDDPCTLQLSNIEDKSDRSKRLTFRDARLRNSWKAFHADQAGGTGRILTHQEHLIVSRSQNKKRVKTGV